MPAPTVTSISPSSGPTAGSTSVTITGTNFTGTTGVTIGGASASSVTVVSSTSITCTTPAGSAGTASVVVTNASGSNSANTLYTYVAAPTVTGITANRGPLSGGTFVTITGTNFTGATGVTIGGSSATSLTVVNSSTITCYTPSGSAGTASVLVTTVGGTNSSNSLYTYMGAPSISSIYPAGGPLVGGTVVTISGANFTAASSVTFDGVAATGVSVLSDGSITCTSPLHAAGAVSLLVTAPGGTNGANSLFTYVVPPTVTSLTPTSGISTGGTLVTITGTNFTGATNVTFRGVSATSITVVNATTITCYTPAGTVGIASVLVTTAGGANAANGLFTYQPPPPTINDSGVSPAIGSTLGGTPVTINGANFNGAGSVTIGGVPATNVTVVSSSKITCITPAGSLGDASVVVTTPSGSNADNALFEYQILAPTINPINPEDELADGISPASGSSEGGTFVTISGNYFTGATGVTIDGEDATHVVVIDDNTITCLTPAGDAGPARSVVVTTPSGSNAGNTLFTYVASLPIVTAISPPIGATTGGISVTITGRHLSGVTAVTIGGIAVPSFSAIDDTTISCITPAGIAGTASVLVTTGHGTNSANSLYLYIQGTPTDTYIYLKGGRGDGFVPQWTGALTEEGMVNDTGTILGTAGREVSEPYRDIFPSSTVTQNYDTAAFFWTLYPYLKNGTGSTFYPDEGTNAANTGKGRLSDEVSHTKPRQFVRASTWMIFMSSNGLPYKFRKDLVLGWGSKPRGE